MYSSDTPLYSSDRPPLFPPLLPLKVGGWIRRYLPAELTGTTAALVGIVLARHFDQPTVTIALVGAWSEVIGFYGAMVMQEWLAYRRHHCPPSATNKRISKLDLDWLALCGTILASVRQTIGFLAQLLRNLLLEFGVAELLDPFILRPALLTLAMQLIPELPIAVIVGKVAADLLFYSVAIGSYELRKKMVTASVK